MIILKIFEILAFIYALAIVITTVMMILNKFKPIKKWFIKHDSFWDKVADILTKIIITLGVITSAFGTATLIVLGV